MNCKKSTLRDFLPLCLICNPRDGERRSKGLKQKRRNCRLPLIGERRPPYPFDFSFIRIIQPTQLWRFVSSPVDIQRCAPRIDVADRTNAFHSFDVQQYRCKPFRFQSQSRQPKSAKDRFQFFRFCATVLQCYSSSSV